MTAWNWIELLEIPHTVSRFCPTLVVVSVREDVNVAAEDRNGF